MSVSLASAATLPCCGRTPSETHAPKVVEPSGHGATVESSADATVASADAEPPADADASEAATVAGPRDPGPFNFTFAEKRTVFVVAPKRIGTKEKPQRLIAMLHGICNPPEYACGLWASTGVDLGFLVCPKGETSCGPAQYDAPTWTKPEPKIDEDLELAIETTMTEFPGEISRDDAVLCGFSRGAYMAVRFAAAHPGRWPYLVLNEANVQLDVAQLKKAKVRAVALIAGEIGGQIGGEKKTAAKLEKAGFPVRFWPMPKAGHWYSDDIPQIMKEAIDFVTSYKDPVE
jgi:hypothetical protein